MICTVMCGSGVKTCSARFLQKRKAVNLNKIASIAVLVAMMTNGCLYLPLGPAHNLLRVVIGLVSAFALMAKTSRNNKERGITMDVCPNCGKPVNGSNKFCTNCGTSLVREMSETPSAEEAVSPPESHDSPVSRSAPTASPSTTNRRVGRCKYCGKIIHVGDNPCPNCGHELKWGPKSASQESHPSSRPHPTGTTYQSTPSGVWFSGRVGRLKF